MAEIRFIVSGTAMEFHNSDFMTWKGFLFDITSIAYHILNDSDTTSSWHISNEAQSSIDWCILNASATSIDWYLLNALARSISWRISADQPGEYVEQYIANEVDYSIASVVIAFAVASMLQTYGEFVANQRTFSATANNAKEFDTITAKAEDFTFTSITDEEAF